MRAFSIHGIRPGAGIGNDPLKREGPHSTDRRPSRPVTNYTERTVSQTVGIREGQIGGRPLRGGYKEFIGGVEKQKN